MARSAIVAAFLVAAAVPLVGCGDQPGGAHLAPSASGLVAEKKAEAAKKFSVDPSSSKVTFLMDAPQEKIRGVAAKSMGGSLEIDPKDLAKTTGVVTVDISGLELFQTKADDDGKMGEETKSDLQNEHARAWLEIGKDAPEAERKKNERVEFSIKKVDKVDNADITKVSGAERKAMITATGDVLLHGRKSTKTVELEATFTFDGDKPKSVHVKTVKPFLVGLAEHDVRPREAFGKLAAKTLDVLAPKVAKDAPIEIDFVAVLGDAPAPGATPAPAASDAPAPSASAASSADAPAGSAAPSASAAPAASGAPAAPSASAKAK